MPHANTHVYRAPAGPSAAGIGLGLVLVFLAVALGVVAVDRWGERAEFAAARACQNEDRDGCVDEVAARVRGWDVEERRRRTTHVVYLTGDEGDRGWSLRAALPGREPPLFDRLYEDQRVTAWVWDGQAVRIEVPHAGTATTHAHPHAQAVRGTLNALVALSAGVALLVLTLARRDGRLWRTALPLCGGGAAVHWVSSTFGATDPYRLGATFLLTAVGAALILEIDLRRTARAASLPTWSAARPATP